MKLNSPRRLVKEDYPAKYRDLMDKLVSSINEFMGEVSQGFNKRLNFNDNFEAFEVEISYVGGGTVRVRNDLQKTIRGANVLRVDTLSNSAELLTGAPFIQFTNATNEIIIKNITGLTVGNKYTIRVVFFT